MYNRNLIKIRKPYRDFIDKINEIDNNLMISLVNNKPYVFTISLDDLYIIKPVDRKVMHRYSKLIKYLMTIGIEMRVIDKKDHLKEIINLIEVDKNNK